MQSGLSYAQIKGYKYDLSISRGDMVEDKTEEARKLKNRKEIILITLKLDSRR